MSEDVQKKFFNLYLLECEKICNKKRSIFKKMEVKIVELRSMYATLKSNPKKEIVEFFNYFENVL